MMISILSWLVFGLCLTLSFLLSGMEAGVFALSRLRVRQHMRAGRPSARLLYRYLENPENFLWTILVGNTIVNLLILGWIIPTLHSQLRDNHVLLMVVLVAIVFLFYALFDLLPKTVFRTYPNRLCMFAARPFRFVHLALWPLVALVEQCSILMLHWTGRKAFTGRLFGNREELRQVMQESGQSLSSEERTMINRVLDLPSLTVRQLTTPLNKTLTASAQTTAREVLALAREHGIVRLPVWQMQDGKNRIVGLIALRQLLFHPELDPEKPVGDFVRPALYLEEDLRLEVALRRMQRGGQRLAVVLGRDGREVGVIGLEDILEFVFGDVNL